MFNDNGKDENAINILYKEKSEKIRANLMNGDKPIAYKFSGNAEENDEIFSRVDKVLKDYVGKVAETFHYEDKHRGQHGRIKMAISRYEWGYGPKEAILELTGETFENHGVLCEVYGIMSESKEKQLRKKVKRAMKLK